MGRDRPRYRGYGNYGATNGPRKDPGGVGSLFSREAVAQWAAIHDITNLSLIGCSLDKSADNEEKSVRVSGNRLPARDPPPSLGNRRGSKPKRLDDRSSIALKKLKPWISEGAIFLYR